MPEVLEARIDPGPMLALSAVFGVSSLLSVLGMNDWAAISEMVVNSLSCVTGEANAFNENDPAGYLKSHLGCITGVIHDIVEKKSGAFLAAPVLVVLNALNGGVQLVVAQGTGAARSVLNGVFGSDALGADRVAMRVSSEDTTPQYSGTDIGMDEVFIAQTWISKGARLNLIPNYTGTLYFHSGCCNEREWNITWDYSGGELTLQVGELLLSKGSVSPQVTTGDTVEARLESGVVRMSVPSESGMYEVSVCNSDTASQCPG